MDPLWRLRSGNFAGHRDGDVLYDADGSHVGYFRGDVAYSISGHYIGELYEQDRIGKRSNAVRTLAGARARHASRAAARHANRAGRPIAGWEDPDF
jgi:4-fold beta-flower domain-containing protein